MSTTTSLALQSHKDFLSHGKPPRLNMETKCASSAIVSQVLDVDNYFDWSVQVKTYLMAKDLWDIVEATDEPPKQENDEAASKAWTKKNAKALHGIQLSCGPRICYALRRITSAKIAWDSLAAICNFPKRSYVVFDKEDYVNWSFRMKKKLIKRNLWDVVEAATKPPTLEYDFNSWSKKNCLALYLIWESLGPLAFTLIGKIDEAKIAWNTLARKYNPKRKENNDCVEDKKLYQQMREGGWEATNDSLKHHPTVRENITLQTKTLLHKAVFAGQEHIVKELVERHPNVISENITDKGKTLLHMAVFAGHEHIVKELLEKMSDDDLERTDDFGYTALAETTLVGNLQMAKCMLRKKMNLVSNKSKLKLLPVVLAVFHGHIRMARYLYTYTPLEDLKAKNGHNGVTLIIQTMFTREFDIALDLIRREPSLAFALDREKCSPLNALASVPSAFLSRDRLVFWKKWIFEYCIHIELPQNPTTNNETRLNIEDAEGNKCYPKKNVGSGIFQQLYKMKWDYVHSDAILQLMCEGIPAFNLKKKENHSSKKKKSKGGESLKKKKNLKEENRFVSDAIFRAIKEGLSDFVSKILEADPYLIWARDKNRGTLFHQAVLYREAKIFCRLHERDMKDSVMDLKDNSRNNVLHMAGISTPSIQFKHIPGAVLQMQKELQWFKELEQIVHPKMREDTNKEGRTPQELFTEEHKDMKKEGEEWMKNTATSYTVVGALIVTIMFAAAFTVPGGNDQTGFPTFLNEKVFMLFIVSDAFSLFSSSTSVLMFLGILTSRYEEEDFLKSLPRKMIIGLLALFCSITTMMIAFSAGLLLMLQGHSWIFLPVICLASVPVIVFVLMQSCLLGDMIISTYGPSIFDRKMKFGYSSIRCSFTLFFMIYFGFDVFGNPHITL